MRWQRLYRLGLLFTDALVIVWVVFGTQIAWLGFGTEVQTSGGPDIPYTVASIAIVILWIAALSLNDTRSFRVTGVGVDEYQRVFWASFVLFACVAIVAYLLQWQIARGFVLIAFPAGVLVLIFTRWLWRQWLGAKRERYEFSRRVLMIGSIESATHVTRELAQARRAGYHVVAACVPGDADESGGTLADTGVPILGGLDEISEAIERTQADTVVIASTDDLPAERVKRISWSLEQGRRHLVVAPSLTDIAGPRIRTRPVAGLPLIHVETPNFSFGQRVLKRTLDIVASTLGIMLLSPLLITLAVIVKVTSPGPVLFRQERVGFRGRPFRMLKFRSMVIDAEARLEALKAQQNAGNDVMFKMRDDPRITRVGAVMRRYSIDELPQLFNVLGGSMSLVGPRPPLPREVEQYATHVHRRFLVKPGITGLWQVSGRSSLSWEDTVRLDLSYVENWSLLGDLLILMKTVKAVLAPGDTAA